jgi:hypothetical protein
MDYMGRLSHEPVLCFCEYSLFTGMEFGAKDIQSLLKRQSPLGAYARWFGLGSLEVDRLSSSL